MIAGRWQEVEEAVALAFEIPIDERERWLADFCGDDVELKAEIESLLTYSTASENFLENTASPMIATILAESETSLTGKQFGNYQIIREIGRGGMGAVFLVERRDGEFEQQAALKIIRQTFAGADIERYFRRERQILASLNHPNIARLLDGGVSESGELFLVMEYIAGDPLLQFVEKHQLSETERLKIFVKICSAVAFAHRNLIVHRDIKPSNVLVTETGEPKLLDFGLAKIVDQTLPDARETQTHFRALTPAYASPEQKRGENITTTSDIYSLGRVLTEIAPNPLPDLKMIAQTALREEPERRYPSVEAFAADIENYLTGKPVRARPPTFRYRAEKFIKRNFYAVSAVALIVLSLISGVAATFWQARRAEAQRLRAEKRFGEVRRLANSLMFEIHDSVQNLQGSTATRELIVSRALEYLDSLAQESGDDANLQIELATAYEKIGTIQGNPYSANLGDTSGALESYRKAVTILENLNQGRATTFSQMALGRVYRARGDIAEVKSEITECVDYYRRSLVIFKNLAQQNQNDEAVQDELARAFETLGDGLSRTAEGATERLENYQQNLAIRQNLAAQNLSDRKLRRSLALAYLKVGGALGENYPEAETKTRQAIKILAELAASDQTDARARRETGFALYQLGNVLTEAKEYSGALEARQQAFNIRQTFAANDLENKQARFDLAAAYADLSEAFTNLGDVTQALENARQAQNILGKLSDEDPNNAVYRRNVGLADEKFALAFAQAASDEKLANTERLMNWEKARNWYQKTQQVFVKLRDDNSLQPRDAGQIERFSVKINTCDQAITRLSSAHKTK